MRRMAFAKTAILGKFKFISCRSLILGCRVIPSFALTTSQNNRYSITHFI